MSPNSLKFNPISWIPLRDTHASPISADFLINVKGNHIT